MAWPTVKPDSTKFDNANDSIAESRAELKTASDNLNDIIDFIDVSGITNNQILVYDSATGTLKAEDQASGNLNTNLIVVGDQSNTSSTYITTGQDGKPLVLTGGLEDSAGGSGYTSPSINIGGFADDNISLSCTGGGSLQLNSNAVSLSTPGGYAGSVIGYWKVIVPGYGGVFAYIELKR